MNNEDLKKYIEKIEKLEEDRQAVSEDIKQVYEQAKSSGFDVKALKEVIKLRKIEENPKLKSEYAEKESWVEVYKNALGLV